MRNVFTEFSDLWPASSHASLEPLLINIPVFYYPSEKVELGTIRDPSKAIVVCVDTPISEIVQLVSSGFEHCLQRSRSDFAQELLASALMLIRPQSFSANPVPFFFTGFSQVKGSATETNMSEPFRKTSEKSAILAKLELFLEQNPRLQGISDLCVQVADELISNALFSAPIDNHGKRSYQETDRFVEVTLPENKANNFFACFSSDRVIVGCEDQFGSFNKHYFVEHLENIFLNPKSTPRIQASAGAGLGFRYIIENSANLYLYCDKRKRSLVAVAFLLQGLKANLSAPKHFHLSIK